MKLNKVAKLNKKIAVKQQLIFQANKYRMINMNIAIIISKIINKNKKIKMILKYISKNAV